MTTKKKLTAAELMKKLQADPSFAARQAMEEEELQERELMLSRAEKPLVDALERTGVEVDSVWDLVNTSAPCSEALAILLEHLQKAYPAAIREGIARALAVPEAKFGWSLLVKLYGEEQEQRVKDGLAVALAATADEELIEELLGLVQDSRHGASRLLLLSALERSRNPKARATLMQLVTDTQLQKEVQVILGRLKRRRR